MEGEGSPPCLRSAKPKVPKSQNSNLICYDLKNLLISKWVVQNIAAQFQHTTCNINEISKRRVNIMVIGLNTNLNRPCRVCITVYFCESLNIKDFYNNYPNMISLISNFELVNYPNFYKISP